MAGSSADPPIRSFPTTHWSLIDRVRKEDVAGARVELDGLLRQYLPALRAHLVSRRMFDAEQIDDLLQGFVSSKILECDLIGGATQVKGKFRTLLLTSLDRYVISQQRYQQAQKRGGSTSGGSRTASLDQAGERDLRDTRPTDSDAFDIAWGRQVLSQTLERMRSECEQIRRADLWGVFECRIVRPILRGEQGVEYGHLVREFGFRSPSQAWNALTTSKRMFARILRGVIEEYAQSPEEVDQEIRDLQEVLSRHS